MLSGRRGQDQDEASGVPEKGPVCISVSLVVPDSKHLGGQAVRKEMQERGEYGKGECGTGIGGYADGESAFDCCL